MGHTYEEIVGHAPKVREFYTEEQWNWNQRCNESTGSNLMEMWLKNLRLNAKEVFPHCGTVRETCEGIGTNKASIMIGAGPSLNKEIELLRRMCFYNSTFPFETQPFLFFCCNHEFKRMVRHGIIPHFVVAIDGAEGIYDQLCTSVPASARGCILLAPPRISHRITTEWRRQGRDILFFLGDNKELVDEFKNITGIDAKKTRDAMVFGGNVLNQMYILGAAYMNCNVYMALGNDLCYEYDPDLAKRRKTYYADGNYTTNIASGRDEANKFVPYMGYTLQESILMPGQFGVKFVPKATTAQLILYKTWMEVRVGIQEAHNHKFHYYNCSEGILGVLCKDRHDRDMFKKPGNWFLLDEIFPLRWHTRTLNAAVTEFLEARKLLCQKIIEETPTAARFAVA